MTAKSARTFLCVTPRDRAIIHACYSLGWAPGPTFTALYRDADRTFLQRRMRRLSTAGYLELARVGGSTLATINLFAVGRAALPVGQPRPWRPRPAQIEHTLAVGDVLAQLATPGRWSWLQVEGWQGEAELRDWAAPGDPYPDLQVNWQANGIAGSWCVEVDRGTESGPAWRRKLVRYLRARPTATILAVTTGPARARNLAQLGIDVGVHVQALSLAELRAGNPPEVHDSRTKARLSLLAACTHSV
ncbi:MAG TPA: replication-relaxation family protein [Mycobacteriales bacterium]|nr:replication-relaxation family protein [Mycobacteriales bacterium]